MMRRHQRITEDEIIAVPKAPIKLIVSAISPELEVCFDEKAREIIFIIRSIKTSLILTPAIHQSGRDLLEMSDEQVRTTISESSIGSYGDQGGMRKQVENQ